MRNFASGLIGFAVAMLLGATVWSTPSQATNPIGSPPPTMSVCAVVVDRDRPVTVTVTRTSTRMVWEKTAAARPTHTITPYRTATTIPTRTPLPPLQNETVSDTEG